MYIWVWRSRPSTANEPRTTSVEPADQEHAAVAASAPAEVDVATAASASAASAPTPSEGTHRWRSGPVLRALLLALVLEPIGALIVDTEHLTIFSFVLPFLNLHQTLSWHHWCHLERKGPCSEETAADPNAQRTEPASCPEF